MKKLLIIGLICLMPVPGLSLDRKWGDCRYNILCTIETTKPYTCKKHGKIYEIAVAELQGKEYNFCLHCIIGGLRATIGEVEE